MRTLPGTKAVSSSGFGHAIGAGWLWIITNFATLKYPLTLVKFMREGQGNSGGLKGKQRKRLPGKRKTIFGLIAFENVLCTIRWALYM